MAATKKSMSNAHKQALAEGRTEGRVVRRYLDALVTHKPKRGRKRTADSIKKRLAAINAEMETAEPLKRLQLVQERINLESELGAGTTTVDMAALEDEFVGAAKGYSQRKGITYAAWRELGVPPSVLKRAGINRTE